MSSKQQPIIVIERTWSDQMLEGLALAGLLALLILPAMYYSSLPDTIPHHFNGRGEADGFGSKSYIWALPGIGLAMYFFLTYIGRGPHRLNYMVKITEQNAETQYRMAMRLTRYVKVMVIILFLYITWAVIQGAESGKAALNPWLMFAVLGTNIGLIGWYMTASARNK
ncbi:MAG: DUF1648 domain-containing protein [Saprospiraceae bacterium]